MTDLAAAIARMQANALSMPPDSPKRAEPKPEPDKPAAYRALLNATDGIVRQVVELHHPKGGYGAYWWRCEGCDLGPHPEDNADWPCSTIELIAGQVRVSLREDDYTVEAMP